MRRLLAILAATALTACESDVEKLKRLEDERGRASLSVLYYQGKVDSLLGVMAQLRPTEVPSHEAPYDSVRAVYDSVNTKLAEAKLEHARATAGLEKLLGR